MMTPSHAFLKRLSPPQVYQEPLVRACRLNHQPDGVTIIDATAGLGRDTLLLAAAGFSVIAMEKHAGIYQSLSETLQYWQATYPHLSWLEAIQLIWGDACELFPQHPSEIIYLDPMFAHRSHAKPKKEMAFLQTQVPPMSAEEENTLLQLARSHATHKVVVKRYKAMPPMAQEKPHYTLPGSRIRFDVYLPLFPISIQKS